jgi:hypothetical protein
MTVPAMLLLFGGVLLLIAILGGGFEIQQIKVPKVERAPRMIAAAGGMIFVLMGLNYNDVPTTRDVQIQPASARDSITHFTLHDRLAEGQVSAQTIVIIDGKRVGTLTINEHYPDAMIGVTVLSPGRYSYTLDSRIVFRQGEKLVEFQGSGQGLINVEPKKKFEPQYTLTGNTMLLVLAEVE